MLQAFPIASSSSLNLVDVMTSQLVSLPIILFLLMNVNENSRIANSRITPQVVLLYFYGYKTQIHSVFNMTRTFGMTLW